MADATQALWRRLDVIPSDRRTFEALAELLHDADDNAALAGLYEQRLETLPDGDEACTLSLNLARLYERALDDVGRARQALERASFRCPQDTRVLDELIRVREAEESWPEVALLLERRERLSEDEAESADLRVRLGDVTASRLGEEVEALHWYLSAIEWDPSCGIATDRAWRLSASLGRFREAIAILEKAPDSVATGEAWLELGRSLSEEPWYVESARKCLQRARDAGLGEEAGQLLDRLDDLGKSWKQMSRDLRAEAVDAREKRKAAEGYRRIAELHALYDDDLEKVVENLDRAFMLNPSDTTALEFLEDWFLHREDYAGLVEMLERFADSVKDRQAAARMWARIARLKDERLGDRFSAAEACKRAMERDPRDPFAARLLVGVLEAQGAWEEVADVLERRLAATAERRVQRDLRLSLARVYQRHLEDSDKARIHLEAAFSMDRADIEVATDLEPLLRDDGSAEKMIGVLEARLAGDLEHEVRRRLLQRLADAYLEHLQRPDEAVKALTRALALEPSSERLRSRVAELAEAAGRPALLARALGIAAGVAEGDARLDLLLRLAETFETGLSDPDKATTVYRELLEVSPEHPEALAGLERTLSRSGSTDELTEALQSKLSTCTGADLRDARLALARHHVESTCRLEEARELYESILEDEPRDREALELLAEVGERIEDHPGLADTLSRLIAVAEDDDKESLAVQTRLAHLHAEHLDSPQEAAELYCRVFEADPARSGVTAALEALLADGVAIDRITSLLAPHYAAAGDWPRHVAMLEKRLDLVDSPVEKASLLIDMARIYEEHLVDRRQALVTSSRALSENPGDDEILGRVERLATEVGALDELESVLADVTSSGEVSTISAERRVALLGRLARLREVGLGDLEGSSQAYREVIESTGPTEDLHSSSLEALARIAEAGERWEDLEAALTRLTEQEADEGARAPLLEKLGLLRLERLGRPLEAASTLEAALEAGAPASEVLEPLSSALESAGELERLSEVLLHRQGLAEEEGDEGLASRLKMRRASLLSEGLEKKDEAVQAWKQMLEERPTDPDARTALEDLLEDESHVLEAARALAPAYERTQDYDRQVAVLEIEVSAAKPGVERADMLRRVAEIQARDLRNESAAADTLARALLEVPASTSLREQLRSIAADSGSLDMVPSALDAAAARVEDQDVALQLRLEAAEWAEKRLGDRDTAISRYEAVLETVPGHGGALQALHGLLRGASSWKRLADVCLALAEQASDDGERRSLWREAGRVHEENTGDLSAAAAAYRKILEAEPSDLESARALERLYDALDRPEDLAWVLEVGREQVGLGDRHQELSFRLAELRQARLGDLDSALDLYRELLEEDSGHRQTRDALERLVEEGGALGDRALRLLDQALSRSEEHRARAALRETRLGKAREEGMPEARLAELYAEMRRIQEEDMDAADLAFMTACRQLSEGIAFEVARDEAERLARECGTADALSEVFDEVAADLSEDDPTKVDLLRRTARLRTEAGFTDEAIATWKRVQALAPADRSVLEALEGLYQARHDAADLVEIYRQKVDLTSDSAERTTARLELARLLEQTGATEAAIEAYEVAATEAASNVALARRALEQLDRLYGRAERWKDLARVLAAFVKLLEGTPERLGYLLRLGELFEEKDADPSRALEIHGAIVKEGESSSSEVAGAIEGLERLMARDEHRVRAAAILEPIYRASARHRQLADTLEARLTATKGNSERLEILEELAKIYEDDLGQRPLAFMVWCRAFREAPEHEGVGERLEVLAKETDGWEELASVYEDEIERLGQGSTTVEARRLLHERLSDVYETRLADPAKSIDHQRSVFELAPSHVAAGRRLATLLESQGPAEEVVAVRRRLVDIVEDPEEKRALWASIAVSKETSLEDRSGAMDAWREALALCGDSPDPEILSRLARLYEEAEDWESLASIYDLEISAAESAEESLRAAEWLHTLGGLRFDRLDDSRGAIDAYARCLELNPYHPEVMASLEAVMSAGQAGHGETQSARDAAAAAAAILEPRYEESGDSIRRAAALEVLSSAAGDPEERSSLLVTLADIHEHDGQNDELAFMALSRALRATPERPDLLERLQEIASKAELEEEEAGLLEELLPSVGSESVKATYLRRYSALQAEAGEVSDSTEALRALLEIRPDDEEALDRLARLNRLEGDYGSLVEVLRRQLSVAADESRRLSILRQIASVQEERLSDTAASLATWRQLLQSAPDDREALARMDAICVREERFSELEEILGREARVASEAGDTAAQVGFLSRLADLRADQLNDPEGAMDLYRQVLELAPGHPDTVARLEGFYEKDSRRVDAARVLEDVYRQQERWDKLLSTLEGRVSAELDKEVRRELLWEIHEIHERNLDSPDMAFLVLCRSFNEDPAERRVRKSMERLADVTGQYEELVAVYEDAIEEIGMPSVATEMRATMARLYDERLHEPDRALELWEQVIGEPLDEPLPALKALDRLYRRKERWPELADVLEREAALLEDPQEKAPVLFRLGQLCAETLEDPDRAAGVFESLTEIDPGHLAALRGLEALYEQAGAWEKLAANLESQLSLVEEAQAKERLTGRLAEVVGERLGDVERAIELWLEVLESNKRSDAALTALEKLYEKAERWEDLAELLRMRLKRTVDPREVTRLSARLGWVLGTRLGEADDAIESFKSVLERDPRNEQVLNALWEIYDSQQDWEELIVVLKRLAPLQDTPEGLRRVRFRLTEVLGLELNKKDEALEAARRFLDVQPHEPESLKDLEGLLSELGAKGELVKVMELRARALAREMKSAEELLARVQEAEEQREKALAADVVEASVSKEASAGAGGAVDSTPSEMTGERYDETELEEELEDVTSDDLVGRITGLRAERIGLSFEIARAHDELLEKPIGGAPALDEVLSIEPSHRDAFSMLRNLYEEASRWRDMAALLERFLPYGEDSAEQKGMLQEISLLQERRLGQKELAFMALGRAFAVDPSDSDIESELLRLALETDAWDEAAAIFEDVAEDVEGTRKTELLLRLAEIQDEKLDEPEEAESTIRRSLTFDPGNKAALDALAGLFADRGHDTELVVALEQKLEASGEIDEQKSILGKIARIHEEQLSNVDEAVATWRRVLDLDGGDGTAIDSLVRLFEQGQRWEELVGILERAVDSAEGADEKADLQHRLAQVFEERLEDDERAIAALRSALELSSVHAPSMAALERIFTRLERWSELLETYEAQVASIEEDEKKVPILLKIAALQEDTFDRVEAAIEAMERLLEIDPAHGKALRDLGRLLRHAERWERLVEVLQALIGLSKDTEEAVRLHLDLAEIWDEQLESHDKAEQTYRHALEIDPESREALRALGELYQRVGNWAEAVEMLEREAKVIGPESEAVSIHERMGEIYEERLLDPEEARLCHTRAVEIEPSHLPSLRALKRLAEQDEDWDTYLNRLIEEARYTDDLEKKTRLLCEAGFFVRDKREDPDRALDFFEQALEKTEDDLEASEAAAALHLERESWERTEQLLTVVCEKHEEAGEDPEDLCRRWYKLAYVRRKLRWQEKTLEAFAKAYEHDATYLPALEGLGASLVEAARWEEALKIFQTILIHHRDAVTDLEVVEYYWQLGEINGKLGQNDRAVKAYEKALEIDPSHEPSLSGIIRRLEALEEWDDAIEYRHRLLDVLDGEEKYEMYLAVGRQAHEKLEDPYQAIDAYQGAARMRPDAVAPLESLRVLYRETRQSAKRAEVLRALLSHPEVNEDKAKVKLYNFRLAELLRDDLKDVEGALRHFEATLDADYTFAKAFEAIEAILVRQKRWGDLEQAYARMIQRIPKSSKTHAVRMGLWRMLGDLYWKVLKSLDGAIAAYQVVAKGDPEDAEVIETLAELLSKKPGAEAEAVKAFHQALKVTTEPVRVARAMLDLYSAQKSYDKAFCVVSVINHLIGDPKPGEETLYNRLKPFAKDKAQRSMSDRLWEQLVYHDKLKGPVAEILAIIHEQAGAELAADARSLGLNPKKDRVDPASSNLYFASIFKQVGQVMGMEGVPLYKRADQAEGLAVANTYPTSLVGSEEMMGRSGKKALWFSIAKALAFTRPELAIGRLHGLEDIEIILHTAVSLVKPGLPASHDPRVQKLQRRLQRALSPGAMHGLSQAVARWRSDNIIADLRAYAEGVEHTANRTGILLCADVAVAKACLMEDRGGAAKLPLRTKVRELVMFCLSEEYFSLRESLGLAVEVKV